MIPAFEAVKAIHDCRGDAVVVGTMTPNRYWDMVTDRPELDLPVFGAMGKASSLALGVALAQPHRRVVVLDGDGALLMNLGSLVTIAGRQPANLVHFVFDDGAYYTTGGQPVPGDGRHDFAAIASGAGIEQSYTFDDLEDLVGDLPRLLSMPGPVFVALKVSHEPTAPGMAPGQRGAGTPVHRKHQGRRPPRHEDAGRWLVGRAGGARSTGLSRVRGRYVSRSR